MPTEMTPKPSAHVVRIQPQTDHLLDHLDKLYRLFAIEEGHTAPPEHFREFVAARLADDAMLVVLALTEDAPTEDALTEDAHGEELAAGYALVFDVESHPFIPDWARAGYITQMFVHEDFRRHGVGRQMVAFCVEWLRQRGVEQVMLNVDVDNPHGEQFWRAAGFEPYLTRMKLRIG